MPFDSESKSYQSVSPHQSLLKFIDLRKKDIVLSEAGLIAT